MKQITKTSIVLKYPKIEQGSGSIIKVELMIEGNKSSDYYNYQGFVTYDQGSNEANIKKPETS